MVEILQSVRRGHRGLYRFAVVMAALVPVLLVLALVDRTEVTGAPVWDKPLKFAVSMAVYAAALSVLLRRLSRPSRAVRIAARVVVVTAALEMVWVVGQAARHTASHFNEATTFDALAFDVAGGVVAALWVATLVLAMAVIRHGGSDPVMTRAVRAGLVLAQLGFVAGVVMAVHGSHAVGVADGGPGLPLVGWSTTGGDLRIAHFVGLHAIQVLPLLAVGVAALGRDRWGERTRLRLVAVAAVAYGGLIVLLGAQAMAGEPLLQPGFWTLVGWTVLVGGTVVGACLAVTAPALGPARETITA